MDAGLTMTQKEGKKEVSPKTKHQIELAMVTAGRSRAFQLAESWGR